MDDFSPTENLIKNVKKNGINAERSNDNEERSTRTKPFGLRNLGTTCYLNTLVQMVYSLSL